LEAMGPASACGMHEQGEGFAKCALCRQRGHCRLGIISDSRLDCLRKELRVGANA